MAGHQWRLTDAFRNIERKAALRKARHDARVNDVVLDVGVHVLIRNRIIGRNKIQDASQSDPYVITEKPDPTGNVYVIKPLRGNGTRKTMNRRDLRPIDHVSSSDEESATDDDDRETDRNEEETEDDDEDDLYQLVIPATKIPNRPNMDTEGELRNADVLDRTGEGTPPIVDTAGELRNADVLDRTDEGTTAHCRHSGGARQSRSGRTSHGRIRSRGV